MRRRRRKCRHCKEFLVSCPSVGDRQTHCSKPECQRARKAGNNRAFRAANPDYWRGRYQATGERKPPHHDWPATVGRTHIDYPVPESRFVGRNPLRPARPLMVTIDGLDRLSEYTIVGILRLALSHSAGSDKPAGIDRLSHLV